MAVRRLDSNAARHARQRVRAASLAAAVGLAMGSAACSDSTAPTPSPHVEQAWVTASVFDSLSPSGTFPLALFATPIDGEIAQNAAVAFATAYVQHLSRLGDLVKFIEGQYGGPIDLPSIRACGESWYARASYSVAPPPPTVALAYASGGQWLVTLCNPAGRLQIAATVAGQSRSRVENGQLVQIDGAGNEFFLRGVPGGALDQVVIGPEAAVEAAFRRTTIRVSAVPVLYHDLYAFNDVTRYGGPNGMMWRIELERASSFADTVAGHAIGPTRELFVASGMGSRTPGEVYVATGRVMEPHTINDFAGGTVVVTPRVGLELIRATPVP